MIDEWINQLISPDEAVRAAAAANLVKTPEADRALRRAIDSTDSDLIRAARPVLREMLVRKARRAVDSCPLDLWLERFLRLEDAFEVEAGWRAVSEIVRNAVDRANQMTERPPIPSGKLATTAGYNFERVVDVAANGIEFKEGTKLFAGPRHALKVGEDYITVRHESLQLRSVLYGFFASSGSVYAEQMNGGVVLAGGSVTRVGAMFSIIVAAGDVEVESLHRCIVVTRGSVRVKSGIEWSIVVAGGKVEAGRKIGGPPWNIIRQGDAKIGGLVRFFETADTGLEVVAAEGSLKVTRVIEGQPPHKAGVRVGDVVTALDGTPIKDVEQFRRALRRATVNESTRFSLRRDGQAIDLKASFKGWEPPAVKR